MDGRFMTDAGHLVVAMVHGGTTVLGWGRHRAARVIVGGGGGRGPDDEDAGKDALHRLRTSIFHDAKVRRRTCSGVKQKIVRAAGPETDYPRKIERRRAQAAESASVNQAPRGAEWRIADAVSAGVTTGRRRSSQLPLS
jgi:hypothetical protein